MSAGAEAGLLGELAQRAQRRPARPAPASPTRTATARAGSGRARGGAAGSPGARRRAPSGRRGTSSSRRGRGGTGSRARHACACSCSRCIRSWTPAKTSHSPQRSRPTSGWTSGHGSVSCPATVRAARSTIRWLWAILREQRRAVGVRRTGDAGHDRRARPAATAGRRLRRGQREPGPCVAGMTDGLGDVPVLLAAVAPQVVVRQRRRRCRVERLGQRASWATIRSAVRGPPASGPRGGPRRARPSSMPRHAATMSGAPGSSASTQRRHRWPFAIFMASGRPRSRHIAMIPTTGPRARIDPSRAASRPRPSGPAARRPGS